MREHDVCSGQPHLSSLRCPSDIACEKPGTDVPSPGGAVTAMDAGIRIQTARWVPGSGELG